MAELAKASESLPGQPIANLRLGPPIPDPQKIICIGLNYHDHAKEVGATPPPSPIFFAKFANSLVGPTDDLIPPRDENHVDYEAELAVVIGKAGRYISSENALAHVAGAMAFNDVSARDFQLANQLWTSGKAVDTFGPCGPALVTVDDLGDLQDLSVKTRVNGDTVQNGTTASMIFPIADLIEFLTRVMTLEPGDIIATGTPAGVARAHKPPRFLKAGDVVEVEIQGIGTLKNTVLEAE
jgi:2-keto-4-pentenoate hydratase/2-oxohepta-3-ene-1,7-dioic acid hydratase in catechol pathway